ncbi:MAG: helix-turn-helix transcriptional regulator [Clostridia bacterium]|nr:helix-turn-helix transcriptional regulator [Clostridia bacterium]
MNIVEKIDKMRVARGWTIYKLAQESGLAQQTIHQWFEGGTIPSIPALKSICEAFNVTLAEFFAEHELIEATPQIKELYSKWCCLTHEEQASIQNIVDNYIKSKQ